MPLYFPTTLQAMTSEAGSGGDAMGFPYMNTLLNSFTGVTVHLLAARERSPTLPISHTHAFVLVMWPHPTFLAGGPQRTPGGQFLLSFLLSFKSWSTSFLWWGHQGGLLPRPLRFTCGEADSWSHWPIRVWRVWEPLHSFLQRLELSRWWRPFIYLLPVFFFLSTHLNM